jgi:rhamnulokinase
MKNNKKFLAVDFGASNGRAMLGKYDGSRLVLEELYRFENRPVYVMGNLYWDILRLYSELKAALLKTVSKNGSISSIGIDTWGVDFGLLNKDKMLMQNPIHYRDGRTEGISKEVFKIIDEKTLYFKTGAQFLQINTIFQLYSMVLSNSGALSNARSLLMIGDLINYFLTGDIVAEYTAATTTQLFNQNINKWDSSIIKSLKIPENIFPEVKEPGIKINNIKKEIAAETGCGNLAVTLPAYDTSSEITSIPTTEEDQGKEWAYFCCGTWAMVGIVSPVPIIEEKGMEYGFGNEGGVAGNYHFLKNIIGMWIIQQCRKKWSENLKNELSWDSIVSQTRDSDDNNIFIDVNDEGFEKEIFDMPKAIAAYCKKTSQSIPLTVGEFSRCAFQSLVLAYTLSIRQLEDITKKKIEVIYIVGGGSKNKLLCQWVSDALSLPVVSGLAETTATGNILLQMIAMGEARDIGEAKKILLNSVKLKYYEPKDTSIWQDKYEKYEKILIREKGKS